MQKQTLAFGSPSATDSLKLGGNTSKVSFHICSFLYFFSNYLLLGTVANRILSQMGSKALHWPHPAQPFWCRDTALVPLLWNQEGSSTSSFFHSFTLRSWATYTDWGSSEEPVWRLREIQDTSIATDLEAQRRKTIALPSFFSECCEVNWSWCGFTSVTVCRKLEMSPTANVDNFI